MRVSPILFFAACTLNETEEPTITINGNNYCAQSVDCGNGLLCVNNQCMEPECASSSDCQIEEYCSDLFQCVSGCTLNSDCFAGDLCIEQQCTPRGCRDAELDCKVGEYCDDNSRTCYEDSFDHCGQCSFSQWENGIDGGECVAYRFDEFSSCNWDEANQRGTGCLSLESCFPRYLFDPYESEGGVCASVFKFKTCNPNDEQPCPRGFSCYEDVYNDPYQQPPINVCISDCEFLIRNGLL